LCNINRIPIFDDRLTKKNNVKQIYTIIISICIFLSANSSFGQIGGTETYKFLDLTNSAKIGGLGGSWLALKDGDINNALKNPSLISKEMDNKMALDYTNYFAGINYGYAIYSRSFEKYGSFTGAIQYINYGKFDEADVSGQRLGSFTSSEYAITVGWGRELTPHFSIGANLKGIISQLYTDYNSWGVATDISGTYFNKEKQLTVSLVANNIGYQVNSYSAGNNEPLPFGLAIGMSQKLKNAPIRYHIQYNHIEKWDLTYDNPAEKEIDPITGEEKKDSGLGEFGDKLMRHFAFGVEIIPVKFFEAYFGYNYQRRQELKIDSKTAMVGFTWGIGLNFRKFSIGFSRGTYSLAGSTNNITLSLDLNKFIKKSSVN